jgi:hypothetical protein
MADELLGYAPPRRVVLRRLTDSAAGLMGWAELLVSSHGLSYNRKTSVFDTPRCSQRGALCW